LPGVNRDGTDGREIVDLLEAVMKKWAGVIQPVASRSRASHSHSGLAKIRTAVEKGGKR
jgi:hypothetical protein